MWVSSPLHWGVTGNILSRGGRECGLCFMITWLLFGERTLVGKHGTKNNSWNRNAAMQVRGWGARVDRQLSDSAHIWEREPLRLSDGGDIVGKMHKGIQKNKP